MDKQPGVGRRNILARIMRGDSLHTRAWVRYVLAILLVAGSLALRLVLVPVESGIPFVTFYPAVMIAAVVLGTGPGLLTVVLCGELAHYFFLPPHWSWRLAPGYGPILLIFYLSGGCICFLSHFLRRYSRAPAESEAIAQAGMKELNRDFVTFLEKTTDFIYFKDENSRFRFCSQTLANITGHRSWRDMLGKHDREVFPEDTARIYSEEEVPVFRDATPLLNKTDPYYDADGNLGWVNTNKWPIVDENGKVIGIFGISRDVTRSRLVEQELEKHRYHLEEMVEARTIDLSIAKEAAEAANRAKTTFLRNISHELRTPLNGIMGMTALALRGAIDPKQKEYLNAVERSSQHLAEVVNDILDISRIEADRFTLDERDFELGAVLQTLRSLIGQAAQEKGLGLTIDIGPELAELPLRGDAVRLRQVLLDLTGNAIKFTAEGKIVVRVFAVAGGVNDIVVRFEIQDTGVGIAATDQSRLFNAFEQLDASTTRQYGGTGLGLAISKRLVEAMGGAIGVDSTVGVGSTFWFTARLKKGSPPARKADAPPIEPAESILQRDHSDKRLLLVEDDEDSCFLTLSQLEVVWPTIDVAKDGVEAIACASDTHYDLILMDMQMPRMDGLEATRAIRQLPGGANVPILAMTANVFPEDKQRCLDAGMNDLIPKAVNSEAPFKTILYWLTQPRS